MMKKERERKRGERGGGRLRERESEINSRLEHELTNLVVSGLKGVEGGRGILPRGGGKRCVIGDSKIAIIGRVARRRSRGKIASTKLRL